MADFHLKRRVDGHLMHTATGHLVHTCGDPCTACDGAQPDITVTSTASGGCDPTGTYAFSGWTEDGDYCEWAWKDDQDPAVDCIWVTYCKTNDTYCANANFTKDPPNAFYGFDANNCDCIASATNITAQGVGCANGVLTGSFMLDGDTGPPDCTGESATFSFGSP